MYQLGVQESCKRRVETAFEKALFIFGSYTLDNVITTIAAVAASGLTTPFKQTRPFECQPEFHGFLGSGIGREEGSKGIY